MDDKPMTEEELAVWEILRDRVGVEKAVQRSTLVHMTGITDRVLRDALRSLIVDHKKLICSTQAKPGGYFIASSVFDLETSRNVEFAREISVRERRTVLDAAVKAATDRQVSMGF